MNARNDAPRDLEEKKTAALQTISQLDSLLDNALDPSEKERFFDRVDNAQNVEEVDKAVTDAQHADAYNALCYVIASARELKQDDAYTKATQEKKQAFEGKLAAATTAKDAQDATTESLNKARTELTEAMSGINGETQDLIDKKAVAKQSLMQFYAMIPTQINQALDKVKHAQNADEVVKVVKELYIANDRGAAACMQEAFFLMDKDGYTKVTQEKQQAFEEKLAADITALCAQDTMPYSLVKRAYRKLDNARNDLHDIFYPTMEEDKTAAKQTIGALTNLDETAKNRYIERVNNANTQVYIWMYVDAAKLVDAKAALEKVITKANTAKGEVAYNNATAALKQAFDGKLTAATTARDARGATTESLNRARIELIGAMYALDGAPQALEEKKVVAKLMIGVLTNLDENAKKSFVDRVTNAQNVNGVNNAVTAAQLAALEKVITKANTTKGEVAFNKASDEKKNAFKEKLDAATTAKDAQNATVESLNKARTELEGAMGALDGVAQELKDKKTAAKRAIDGLTNLNETTKESFARCVTSVRKAKTVAKVVAAAQLADAKVKALKELDNLGLTPEQKDAAKKAIEKATSTEQVDQAVNEVTSQPQVPAYPYAVENIAESEDAHATTTLYRLYNKWTHEHLFTTDKNEYDMLVAAGWTAEESTGKVAIAQGKGVYRLYNPTTGEHHYTTDADEVANCVKVGWVNEGIHFYSVKNGEAPVYSMYNPYEKKFYHHYTSDPDEIARMVKAGWVKEGIKWYEAK